MTITPARLLEQAGWPSLPLTEWQDTQSTLHRWFQIVGKTRLALATPVNHWWHVTLYLSSRGLTTSAMPYGDGWLEVEFDFIDHQLMARTSDGAVQSMRLAPQSVADFYRDYMALLRAVGAPVKIWPVPRELADTLGFADDRQHHAYDRDAVHRCWTVLSRSSRVLQQFRGRFIGKCSPVHFFWGAFDLACTRFSGRTAPTHPGGVPNLPDWAVREAYSHECISAGWWPGGGAVMEPAFYAYSYPEPSGFAEARVQPDAAYYSPDLKEFILPYDAVRTASRPDELLLEFLQSTYAAGANLGRWDRGELERESPSLSSQSPAP